MLLHNAKNPAKTIPAFQLTEQALSTLSWSLVQAYALSDVGLGLTLRSRYDSDAAMTTTMIWFVSVPCALGATLFTLKAWPILRRRVIMIGLLPWFMTAAEATALAIIWLRF